MGGLGEGCKEPYSHQVSCIIKLALTKLLAKQLVRSQRRSNYAAPWLAWRKRSSTPRPGAAGSVARGQGDRIRDGWGYAAWELGQADSRFQRID